jgi:hypothetical protein
MLAAYLVWHLRKAWAPLTFTDENRPDPGDPVAPAKRSRAADLKASTRNTNDGDPAHSFTSLLNHLATLTRNHIHIAGHDDSIGFELNTTPTTLQRQAFELIGCPIPTELKVARTTTPGTSEIPATAGISHVNTVVTSA